MTPPPTRRFRPRRFKPGGLGSWTGHLPFINELVAAFQPSLFVELGTHYGESYFGICQAVEENGVDCRCVAVDTWLGDLHSGSYDESVFDEVQQYNSRYYREFSYLVRCTFDEALGKFSDESIDLLHIDGLHTYQAVKHDFENWLPKVRPGGIILLHDTQARHAEFAVWQYWEELAHSFPHFEFVHSWGLGLVRKDGDRRAEQEFVTQLWSSPPEARSFIRHYYSLQADALEASRDRRATETEPGAEVLVQAFPCLDHGYSEETAAGQYMRAGAWQTLTLELPLGSPSGPIRLDPSDRPGVIEIAGIRLRRAIDRSILKSWNHDDIRIVLQQSQGIVPLPSKDGTRSMSFSRDPQFLLPVLEGATGDQPLLLEVSMRLDTEIGGTIDALRLSAAESANRESIIAARGVNPVLSPYRSSLPLTTTERNRIQNEADRADREAGRLRAEVRALQNKQITQEAELLEHRAKTDTLTTDVDEMRTQLDRHREENASMAMQLAYSSAQAERLREALAVEHSRRLDLLKSYSWKTTAPLRKIFSVLARVQRST